LRNSQNILFDAYFSHSNKTALFQLIELFVFLLKSKSRKICILEFSNSNLLFLVLLRFYFFQKKIYFNINHNFNNKFVSKLIKFFNRFGILNFTGIGESHDTLVFSDSKDLINSLTCKQFGSRVSHLVIFNPRRKDQSDFLSTERFFDECKKKMPTLKDYQLANELDYESVMHAENIVVGINYTYSYYRHSGVVFDAILTGKLVFISNSIFFRDVFGAYKNVVFLECD